MAEYATREVADVNKYRAVYNYVMARSPKTSVAAVAERHHAAIALAACLNHHRDQRHVARERGRWRTTQTLRRQQNA